MIMKLVNNSQLINNAWEGDNNCFVVNFATNQVEAVNENRVYNISAERIDDVLDEMLTKGINKYAFEFRAALLLRKVVFGRKKEFDKYMKSHNLDKITKPLGSLR